MWAEALATAVYVRNRVTTSVLPRDTTQYHPWNGRAAIITHLPVFGCRCWYAIPKQDVKKFDARRRKAIFVGCAEQSKAQKILDLETGSVIISRDVKFDDNSVPETVPRVWCVMNEELKGEEIVKLYGNSPNYNKFCSAEDAE